MKDTTTPGARKRKGAGIWDHGLANRGTKDRPKWYGRYMDVDGKQKTVFTKQTSKEAARRFLADIEARVARGLPGVLKVTQDEKAARSMTLADLMTCFLRDYNKPAIKDPERYRRNARAAYNCRIKPYPIAQKAVVELRPADLMGLRDALRQKHYSPGAINDALNFIGRAINWAMDRDTLPQVRNPISGVERMPTTPLEETYPRKDVHRLLRHAPDDLLPLIAFHAYTGCRPGEARGLTWDCMRLDAPVPYVEIKRSYSLAPKTPGSRRLVPIHPELRPYLLRWRDLCPPTPEGLVFPAPLRRKGSGAVIGYRMARTSDTFGLPDLLRMLGCHIPTSRPGGTMHDPHERVWHTFRATFVTAMVEAGADGSAISRIVGHAGRGTGTALMTLNYTHVSLEWLARELGKLSLTPPPEADVIDLDQERERRRQDRSPIDQDCKESERSPHEARG